MTQRIELVEDFARLLALYDAGADLSERGMREGGHSDLYARMRKKMRWADIFLHLREQRPDLAMSRFFGKTPDNIFIKPDGALVVCETPEAIQNFAMEVFKELTQGKPYGIARIFGEAPPPVRHLYRRLVNRDLNPHALLARVTGQPLPNYSMSAHAPVPQHTLKGQPHPELHSISELLVDTALCRVVPNYEQRHEHDVRLEDLTGSLDKHWDASPFTGARTPLVDIVIDRKLAIEVSFGTERRKDGYRERTEWKLEMLRRSGMAAVNVKIESGVSESATLLANALRQVDVYPDKEAMLEVLWAIVFSQGTKDMKSIALRSREGPTEPRVPRNRAASPDTVAVMMQQAPNMSTKQLSKVGNMSQDKARAMRAAAGVPQGQSQADVVRQMFKAGKDRATIAQELGITPARVYAELKRAGLLQVQFTRVDWNAEPDLGKVPDMVLAKKYGVTPTAVLSARKSRGIPAPPDGSVDWDAQPLGKVLDTMLATQLGVHVSAVTYARQRRNIPRYRPAPDTVPPGYFENTVKPYVEAVRAGLPAEDPDVKDPPLLV